MLTPPNVRGTKQSPDSQVDSQIPPDQSLGYKKVEDRPDQEKLDILVQQSSQVLMTIKTFFPFDLFPDQIVIDTNKVDLIYYNFFASKHVFTMLIKDIKSVNLTTSLFFASLYFEYADYEQNPPEMSKLPKKDAIIARRIILGLIACKEQKVDLSQFDKATLAKKLEEIGEAKEAAKSVI